MVELFVFKKYGLRFKDKILYNRTFRCWLSGSESVMDLSSSENNGKIIVLFECMLCVS